MTGTHSIRGAAPPARHETQEHTEHVDAEDEGAGPAARVSGACAASGLRWASELPGRECDRDACMPAATVLASASMTRNEQPGLPPRREAALLRSLLLLAA
jgi:hypothetical protein